MARISFSIVCGCMVFAWGCRSGVVENAPNAKALESDFRILAGHEWSGTLNYKDDASGSIKSAPSTLRVTSVASGAWAIAIHSNDPGWAAEECELRLQNGGAVVQRGARAEPVVLRRVQNGTTELITEFAGVDSGKSATIRNKYIIAARECSFRSIVLHEGAADYFKRYDYHWTW